MGFETNARLVYRLLHLNKYDINKLLRFRQACYFSLTGGFRVVFHQNCTQRCTLKRTITHFSTNITVTETKAVSSVGRPIHSTGLNYLTSYNAALFMSIAHNKSAYYAIKWSSLVKRYKLLIWTLVPLQVVLWCNFLKDDVCHQFVKHSLCETVSSESSVLPSDSLVQLALPTNNHSPVFALFCSLKEFFHLSLRAIYLLCVFSPLLLSYPLAHVSTRCFTLWLRLLFIAVEYSGATFVKLGQWASTRRDLFSKEFCDLFSSLHHRVRPHSWSHTTKMLKQAYGKNWQQVLHLSDQQEPIGSGCIAQVYKGYVSAEFVPSAILESMERKAVIEIGTSDTGTSNCKRDKTMSDQNVIPVAIKVLHPKITETFHRDLKLMKTASKVLTILFPRLHWVNLNQCVKEFTVTMNKQLDMRHEFQCLERFTQDFLSFPNVKIPQPIPNFVRENVLVETFEEGISVSQIVRSTDHSVQFKEELASLGIDVLLQMIFVNNFVHADLHPGNLLVQNIDNFKTKKNLAMYVDVFDPMVVDINPIEESSLKLVLLDCGITTSLSPDDRQKFQEVFTAIVMGEGETVAELFLAKSPINECTNHEVFKKEMKELVAKGCQNLMCVSRIKVAELMNDLFSVLSRHKIQLDSSFATIILAIAMLEGLGRTLDPNLNLMDRARPVLLGEYLKK